MSSSKAESASLLFPVCVCSEREVPLRPLLTSDLPAECLKQDKKIFLKVRGQSAYRVLSPPVLRIITAFEV